LQKTLSFLILFSVCFFAFSQEVTVETEEEIILDEILQDDIYTEKSIFIINSFNYNVKGRSLPFILNTKTELKKGEEITGKTNLNKFIKDKRQLLVNERVLKDDVRIEYIIGEINQDGKYPVDLEIYVEDTFNIIALPYPKYSSNSGLEVTIKARDYNFLGSMQPLRVDIGYKYNEYGHTYFKLMLDSGLPFQAFGLNWFFDFDNYFEYRPDFAEPFYYKNRSAISVDIPIKHTTLNMGFAESFYWNDENADADKPTYGEIQEGGFLSSNPSISWRIPTGLEIGEYGELTYAPSVSSVINHALSSTSLASNRIGPFLYFSHSLYFGRINWIGNFRQGISFDISNSYSYDIHNKKNNLNPWGYSYSITAKGHFIFVEDLFGLSTRLTHRHWIKTYSESAGDVLRGVFDKDVTAEYILALNLDLQVRALRIKPYEWFPNSKLMRILGFDVHLNPVLDAAWYKPSLEDASFEYKYLLFGAGFEFIVYPHRFRSMFFRISAGWDITDITKKTPTDLFLNYYEIFLGMELFY
jgi:hypothetical protein